MQEALSLAEQAGQVGEVPIAALVVSPEGIVVGRGANRVEAAHCQAEHAEICAIRDACMRRADWRLVGCTIYVTLEPCIMCVGLILLSRVDRIVYAAESPLFGYRLDKQGMLALYMKHIKGVTSGVLENDSIRLLREFFSKKRIKHNE